MTSLHELIASPLKDSPRPFPTHVVLLIFSYLAGDVGRHGRRGLGVGGVLGDEARVVGGDTGEAGGGWLR